MPPKRKQADPGQKERDGYVEARGPEVVRLVDRSAKSAQVALNYLLSQQTDREREEGTSLESNGVGLTQHHAKLLSERKPRDDDELKAIVTHYSKQLAAAEYDKKFVFPDESDDDGEETESDDDDGPDEDALVKFTPQAVVRDGYPLVINRRFVDIVQKQERGLPAVSNDEEADSFVERLAEAVDAQIAWTGIKAMHDCVDGALYSTCGFIAEPEKKYVRVFCANALQWVTAQVQRVDGANIHLRFLADGREEVVSGSEALYMYALRSKRPQKLRKVL